MASNAPEQQGSNWYLAFVGNPVFIAGVKMVVSNAMLPPLTAWLSQVRHGIRGSVELTSELQEKIRSTQA